jgi:hypothetical protein
VSCFLNIVNVINFIVTRSVGCGRKPAQAGGQCQKEVAEAVTGCPRLALST